jgi:hypothetical protein
VLAAFRELTLHNAPWEQAVAVCGVEMKGLGEVAFRAQNLMSGGRLKGFATREEGLAWLLQQE